MNEYDFEPVRGLPGALPAGERLIWQGAPSWTRLACQAFHIRAVSAYLVGMLAWRTASAIGEGVDPASAVQATLAVSPLAAAAVALLAGLAWLTARTTVYTLTNRRIVLRFGVALTKAINLPFAIVESGALKTFADGSGDVAVTLKAPNKLALAHIWPHARPWRIASPQPTLRAVPDAARVARLLADAMDAAVGVQVAPVETAAERRPAPRVGSTEAAAA